MQNNKELSTINKYILYFFIYSCIGWILETLYAFLVLGHFDNRGFLIGPLCPIYGFGMLILIICLYKYKGNNLKLFLVASIVLTYFEYIAGFILEVIFDLKWWDYTNDYLNINGRVCLPFALIWGVIAIIVVNYIHPFIEKITNYFINKIGPIMVDLILKVFVIVVTIDFVLSSISYLN